MKYVVWVFKFSGFCANFSLHSADISKVTKINNSTRLYYFACYVSVVDTTLNTIDTLDYLKVGKDSFPKNS